MGLTRTSESGAEDARPSSVAVLRRVDIPNASRVSETVRRARSVESAVALRPREHLRRKAIQIIAVLLLSLAVETRAEETETNRTDTTNSPSKFRSPEDGQFDVSGFLDEKYGFLPIVLPITEPAVGYGAAGGLAFISSPLANAQAGYGRPNITMVAGMGTGNGTWGGVVGDMRHWFDDRVQTLAGAVYASVNLDFHGVGANSTLDRDPLRYNLEPAGVLLQGRYRIGDSRFWAGLNYAFARTRVHFDVPAGTPGLPTFERE